MWVFGSQEGFVLMAKPALVSAADAAVWDGVVMADAADVDEQGLVFAEEKRQTLGDRLLPDAGPAVDVHQRCRGWVHRSAKDIRGRNGAKDGRTADRQTGHWECRGLLPGGKSVLSPTVVTRLAIAFAGIAT